MSVVIIPDQSKYIIFIANILLRKQTIFSSYPRLTLPPGNPYRRGRISTIDLLVRSSKYQLLSLWKFFLLVKKQTILTRTRRSIVLSLPFSEGSLLPPIECHVVIGAQLDRLGALRLFCLVNRLVTSRNLWIILLSKISLYLNFSQIYINFFIKL